MIKQRTIAWKPFSKPHRKYIKACLENTINIAEGAVRAGKTIDNVIAMAMMLEITEDAIHLVSGLTVGAAKLNVGVCNGFGLEYIFKGRSRWGKYKDNEALFINTQTGEKVVIFSGGGKADSYKRIRGNSYGIWLATEINLHHDSFIKEAFNRQLASKMRKILWDMNPDEPSHFIYTDYMDTYQAKKEQGLMLYNYGHFTIFDNISISEERKKEIVNQYDVESIWYKRDILGERLHAEGLIYNLDNIEWTDTVNPKDILWIDLAIDSGYQISATTFSAYAMLRSGKIAVLDTYYFKPSDKSKKAPSEISKELYTFMVFISSKYKITFDELSIDSAEGALRNQFKLDYSIKLKPVVKLSKKDMIKYADDMLRKGVVIVQTENNTIWYKEHKFYRWDNAKEQPVKENDHTCDTFQYCICNNLRKYGLKG